jgi:hypothetical protein
MPSQTKSPETPIQQDSIKETRVDRLANEAASRAAKREQRYDQKHDIFTK